MPLTRNENGFVRLLNNTEQAGQILKDFATGCEQKDRLKQSVFQLFDEGQTG